MTVGPAKLANPKPAKARAAGRSCWYRFYAMFSELFAEEVLAQAGLGPSSVVLDPWLGAGTTTVVAARNGLQSVGIDLNPAMLAIAAGRCIDQQEAERAIATAESASRSCKITATSDDEPLREWFGPSSAGAIRGWHRLILDLFGDMHCLPSAFMLTALFEAAWRLAEPYRSKNPTWVKRPPANGRVDCSEKAVAKSVLELALKKVVDCQQKPVTQPSFLNGTSTKLELSASSVDFVLTSPPYCTR